MKFKVVTKGTDGKEQIQVLEAPTRFAVYDIVQKDGGKVVSISKNEGIGANIFSKFNFQLSFGIKPEHIIQFCKNLSGMLGAGLTLSRALSVVERQSGNAKLKNVVIEIGEAVRAGSTFHDALAKHPEIFSNLLISMVGAGEEAGTLSEALAVVALQMERSDQLRKKIKGAMIYPIIVISAVVLISVLMMIFVVPTLTSTFVALKVPIPFATRVIVAISDFMTSNIILTFGVLAVIIVGILAFLRSKIGKTTVLFVALHSPVIGELTRETYAARTTRTLASLLSSGVQLLRGLEITEEVVGKNVFAKVLNEARTRVGKGDPVSAAFIEHTELYPVLVGDMLAVGEETGKLAEMLLKVAELYENDVEQRTKDLSTIIEPLLMLVIGAGVGVFAVAMIAPIYSLSSAI